ncbi:hypothetical protein GCM10018953_42110 [Streptosporangium nondiastaticum]
MGSYATRAPEPGRRPSPAPEGRGAGLDGVSMHSGLPQDPPGDRDTPRGVPGGAPGRWGAPGGPEAREGPETPGGPRTAGGPGGRPRGVDERRFRSVLGHFATGVVAVTALAPGGRPHGLAVGSFTSVSLDPPLVAFCVGRTSTSCPHLRPADVLTVNVLAEHQRPVCDALAASGGDKFAGLDWTPSPAGNPVFDGALAWIDCSVEAEYPAGDHMIVVCRVRDLDVHASGGPLVFFRGRYGALHL